MAKNIFISLSLLALSSCLFANQISKKTYPLNANAKPKAPIELKSDRAALAPNLAPGSIHSTKKENIKITPPKAIEQNLLSNQAPLPSNQQLSDSLEHDQSFKKPLLNPVLDLEPTDIGFMTVHPTHSKAVEMYVGELYDVDQERYTLAFDDHKLIYFDIQKILEPAPQYHRQNNADSSRKTGQLSSRGKVILSNSFKNTIIRNTSNNGKIIEANHISIFDNRIILDVKEQRINQLPERKNYLNTAVQAIQRRSALEALENLPHPDWKARKTRIHERH